MKRNFIYLLLAGSLILYACCVISCRHKHGSSQTQLFYPLKERHGQADSSAEFTAVKKRHAELMKLVRTNPGDVKSRIALAAIFIQEARITGRYDYYDDAAMNYVEEVLQQDSLHFEALTYKALLFLSKHHFAEGLAIAEKVRAVNPYNAFIHGLLVDANVELGNYTLAVEEAEKMISIRPDLRSYSRVSYLREIHGDYPGAIEAMKLAVDAGLPGDEATEWARVHLGHLYEMTGDLQRAEAQYDLSLVQRPGYAYALAGKGDVALAMKQYHLAIDYYTQADARLTDHGFKESLADAYLLAGRPQQSDSMMQVLVHSMDHHQAGADHDHAIGHYADLELSHIFVKMGRFDKAMEHAMQEYTRRPANIEVNETIALIYYMKNDYSNALPYMEVAMKTKSKDANLLCLAGLLYAKTGAVEKARPLLLASQASPVVGNNLKNELMNVLKSL